MTTHYCTSCGHGFAVGERFCPECGHPADAAGAADTAPTQVQPVPAAPAAAWTGQAPLTTAPPADAARQRKIWWAVGIGGAIALIVIVVLVTLLVTGDDGDGEEDVASQGAPVTTMADVDRPTTTAEPTTTTEEPTTTTTARPTTTRPPTTLPPDTAPPPPGTAAPTPGIPAGFADPWEAVGDWAWGMGLNYQGDCDFMDSMADYGPEPMCARMYEARSDTEIVFWVADFPGGDTFSFWVLAVDDGAGWYVADWSDDDFSGNVGV